MPVATYFEFSDLNRLRQSKNCRLNKLPDNQIQYFLGRYAEGQPKKGSDKVDPYFIIPQRHEFMSSEKSSPSEVIFFMEGNYMSVN